MYVLHSLPTGGYLAPVVALISSPIYSNPGTDLDVEQIRVMLDLGAFVLKEVVPTLPNPHRAKSAFTLSSSCRNASGTWKRVVSSSESS
jgi:hypothetical protein